MPWLFEHGPHSPFATTAEQMVMGSAKAVRKVSLPHYIHVFAGSNKHAEGGVSHIIPTPSGTVLGIAYQINEEQLAAASNREGEYMLTQIDATLDEENTPIYAFVATSNASLTPPSEEYLALLRQQLCQQYPERMVDLYLKRSLARTNKQDAIPVKSPTPQSFKHEYNCELRRLYPWDIASTPFGTAWAILEPGQATSPHNHDEDETFIVLSGQGLMRVDQSERAVGKGDVIYLDPFSVHQLENNGADPLEFLSIYWGGFESEELN